MKTTLALLLLTLAANVAGAEEWCITRSGRIRLRPVACQQDWGERHFDWPTGGSAGGGSCEHALAVVDRDGDLLGYANTLAAGYGSSYALNAIHTVGPDTLGFIVDADGLVPPGNDLLAFRGAGCTGEPLIPFQAPLRRGLVKTGPIWPGILWYPRGEPFAATAASYVIPPLPAGDYHCADFHGTVLDGGFCCVDYPQDGEWLAVSQFDTAAHGLEPPFRLDVTR